MKFSLTFIGIFICWSSFAAVSTAELEAIFKNLTTAIGDYRQEIPQLEIRSSKGQVATYSRLNNTIYIEKAAIAVCEQFGEQTRDAIAFLLAHELTHFYQKHDWQEAGFASTFLSSKMTFEQQRADEVEADTYGAFMSYLAGYQTIDIIPILLEKLYTDYELTDENLSSYPSLANRQSVANQVCEQVKTLIRIYEAGNYFFALDQLEEAFYCFQYVAKYVRCKEVMNNLGATALAAASLMSDREQLPFAYPIALDPQLPLRAPSGLTKKELLIVAEKQLNSATQYDPTYYRAFINLACVFELQEKPERLKVLIEQLDNLPLSTIEQGQVLILKGIAAARKAEQNTAKQFFKKARSMAKDPFIQLLGKHNEQVLNQKTPIYRSLSMSMIDDQINDYNLILNNPTPQESILLHHDGVNDIRLEWLQMPTAIFIQMGKGKVLMTADKNLTTRKGIRIGDATENLLKIYDSNESPLIAKGKQWLIHSASGLIFELAKDGRTVQKWGIYQVD
ncbi:MAG: hypothetical protein AB8G22_17560 [Saprospiraceae bacterium]